MKPTSERFLLTGSTGYIGRYTWRPGMRVLVRRPSQHPDEVNGDLLDQWSLERACEGIDVVFHCAGDSGCKALSDYDLHAVHVDGTSNLLEAAKRAGVRKFVYFSSIKAAGSGAPPAADESWAAPPDSPYGVAKRRAEETVLACQSSGEFDVVVLRLAMVYGRDGGYNILRMLRAIGAGWFPPLPETQAKRSLVHIDDVVRAAHLAAADPIAAGKTYIVSHPLAHSGRELYDACRAVLGLRPISWEVPTTLFNMASKISPRAGRVVESMLGESHFSPRRIETELGWRAQVELSTGLSDMIQHHENLKAFLGAGH
jgi:UDP-glucose 4-epimerase